MATDSSEDKNKYSKRIDEIIEDAEIEAELEAEKKVRVKKTKTALVALLGIVLSTAAYFVYTQKINETADEKPQLSKVAPAPEQKPIPFSMDSKDTPLPDIQENIIKESKISELPPSVPATQAPIKPPESKHLEKEIPKAEKETPKKTQPSPEPAPVKTVKPSEIKPDKKTDSASKPVKTAEHVAPAKQQPKTIEKEQPKKKVTTLSAKQQLDELDDAKPITEKNAQKAPEKTKPAPSAKIKHDAPPVVAHHEEPKKQKTEKPKPQIEPKSEETPAQPNPTSTTGQKGFIVQLGVFSVKDNAENLSKELKGKGFNPIMDKQSGGVFHIVSAGEFSDKKSSDPLLKELKESGFQPRQVKNQNNTYSILLGKFRVKSDSDALQEKLKLKGFQPNEKETRTESYVVKITGFNTSGEALSARKKLEQKGFRNTIIKEIG